GTGGRALRVRRRPRAPRRRRELPGPRRRVHRPHGRARGSRARRGAVGGPDREAGAAFAGARREARSAGEHEPVGLAAGLLPRGEMRGRAVSALGALALSLGTAACGDGPDAAPTTTTTAGAPFLTPDTCQAFISFAEGFATALTGGGGSETRQAADE